MLQAISSFLNVFRSYIFLVHHKAVLYDNGLTLFHTTPTFNVPREQLKKAFENTLGMFSTLITERNCQF